MASIINASTTSGIVYSADNSGILIIQSNNTPAITIDASRQVSFANPLPVSSGGTGGTFTPVQQGGATGHLTNKVYIGWTGSDLRATVDVTDIGSLLGLGISQTWQNMFASRALSTTYTNSTGKPIQVIVSTNSTTSGNGNANTSVAVVSGVTIATITTAESSGFYQLPLVHSFIVPNSGTYSITNTAGSGNTMTIASWTELR
jgi:hypothetical protein